MTDEINNSENKNNFSIKNQNLDIINNDNQLDGLQSSDKFGVFKKNNFYINRLNIIISPLKKRNEKYYQKNKIHLWLDLFFGLVFIFLLISLFYWNFYTQPIVSVEIKQLSDNIISGAENSFEIIYINKSRVDIEDALLRIDLPENFEILETEPISKFEKENNIFYIGQVNRKEVGKVVLKGKFVGEINSHHNVFVSLDYFEKGIKKNISEYFSFTVDSSVLGIEVSTPDSTYSNSEFFGEIKLINNSASNLDNIEVVLKNIDNIGSQNYQDSRLIIKSLKSDETMIREFSGKLIDSKSGVFIINTYLLIGNKKILQNTIEKNIITLDSPLRSDMSCKDNQKEIECKLNLSNLINVELKNIKLTLLGNNDFIISKVTSKNNLNYEKKQIIFNNNFIPDEKIEINLKLKLFNLPITPNNYFSLKQMVEYNVNDQKIKTTFQNKEIKLFSSPKINLWASYYNQFGDQIGSGPLPPRAGLPTNYWIFLNIKNEGDNLSNFLVTGNLPKGAIWIGEKNVLAGDLIWDEKLNSVSWTINSVPTGSNFKSGFKVGIIPSLENVGKPINIFEDIKYGYFDEFCFENIKNDISNLNNVLNDNNLANDKQK